MTPTTVVVICTMGLLFASEDVPVTIRLGGPRQVVAEISESPDEVSVSIQMLAVRAFDRPTNERISRAKAEGYATAALAKYLSPSAKNPVKLSLTKPAIEAAATDGKRYRLTLRVPRKGIQIADSSATTATASSPMPPVVVPTTSANLFTAKSDHETTLGLLSRRLTELIPTLRKNGGDVATEAYCSAIADLEEKGDRSFDALIAEVKKDKMLLANEVEDLVNQVELRRANLLGRLKQAVEDVSGSFAE